MTFQLPVRGLVLLILLTTETLGELLSAVEKL